ncbi:unnamed protein product [Notodromas monacha]|uniref:Uncharacterized protein n=1 Tax=Notodromas monacha TaxID=399045 RepID=A0A7R9GGG4_9CRUS|nr:unnamed protein product [Notodromas monacha]CAG0921678.1 unnamed protein product [Notodromas monacha]
MGHSGPIVGTKQGKLVTAAVPFGKHPSPKVELFSKKCLNKSSKDPVNDGSDEKSSQSSSSADEAGTERTARDESEETVAEGECPARSMSASPAKDAGDCRRTPHISVLQLKSFDPGESARTKSIAEERREFQQLHNIPRCCWQASSKEEDECSCPLGLIFPRKLKEVLYDDWEEVRLEVMLPLGEPAATIEEILKQFELSKLSTLKRGTQEWFEMRSYLAVILEIIDGLPVTSSDVIWPFVSERTFAGSQPPHSHHGDHSCASLTLLLCDQGLGAGLTKNLLYPPLQTQSPTPGWCSASVLQNSGHFSEPMTSKSSSIPCAYLSDTPLCEDSMRKLQSEFNCVRVQSSATPLVVWGGISRVEVFSDFISYMHVAMCIRIVEVFDFLDRFLSITSAEI